MVITRKDIPQCGHLDEEGVLIRDKIHLIALGMLSINLIKQQVVMKVG